MIRYALRCSQGHVFEQWFDNMADYDSKAESGALKCEICGDTKVAKAIMAPNVAGSRPDPAPAPAAPACGMGGCGAGMCGMM